MQLRHLAFLLLAAILSACGILSAETRLDPVQSSGWTIAPSRNGYFTWAEHKTDQMTISVSGATVRERGAILFGPVPVNSFDQKHEPAQILINITSHTSEFFVDLRDARLTCLPDIIAAPSADARKSLEIREIRRISKDAAKTQDAPYEPRQLERSEKQFAKLRFSLAPEQLATCVLEFSSAFRNATQAPPELRFKMKSGTRLSGLA